jgi:hypothetical protein
MHFVEVRPLQDARLPGTKVVDEIVQKSGVQLHPSTMARSRRGLDFEHQQPRQVQALTEDQMERRVEFCQKRQGQTAVLSKICLSDESRIVLGDDKQWVWDRKGENHPSASAETGKIPKTLMIFAVIGKGRKFKLLHIQGTIKGD